MGLGSYIQTLPSRAIGSLGPVKQVVSLAYGRLKRILPDEWEAAMGNIILMAQTIGIANSTDIRSHEWRLNDLRLPGAYDDFTYRGGVMAFFSDYPGGAASVDDISHSDAVGVKVHTLGAGVEAGLYGDVDHYKMQTTKWMARLQIDSTPAGIPDFYAFGIYDFAAGTNSVAFEATDPSNPGSSWNCCIRTTAGGLIASDALSAAITDLAGAWKTFEIETTPTGAVFTYQRGESDEEVITLTGVPANTDCNCKATARSAAGGEKLYNDKMGIRDTRNALIKP